MSTTPISGMIAMAPSTTHADLTLTFRMDDGGKFGPRELTGSVTIPTDNLPLALRTVADASAALGARLALQVAQEKLGEVVVSVPQNDDKLPFMNGVLKTYEQVGQLLVAMEAEL